MFTEVFLTIVIGILVGLGIFLRSLFVLKDAYYHYIASKYALNSHIALKYPQLNDEYDDNNNKSKESEIYQHKFYNPRSYTDPLFNPKSEETEKLRFEFSSLFNVLNKMRDYIIRDFIDEWYKSGVSSDDTKFINHIKFALDGAFQILIFRISTTNWTYFIRDHIFYPLRECLVLYTNIIKQLSKNNPKWDELTEIERDSFIADAIQNRYQWHKGCESDKASIEYLRKWSLLFLEEILDERNFHCFAVRFFCRELLTNNILYPIINLVDGYNVNYAIVSAFIYLETINNDIAKEDIDGDIDDNDDDDDDIDNIQKQEKEEKKEEKEEEEDSNNMISMQDLQEISTPKSINSNDDDENDKNNEERQESETPEIIQKQVSDSGLNQTEISMQTMMHCEKRKDSETKPIRKRKRRASLDMDILDHYYKSFKISHFFIEINGDQSELLQLIPMVIRKGYTISSKYDIESQYKFTIRFVSTQCINLCARWVTLMEESQILGDLSSMKHLKRIEYEQNDGKLRYIYIWNDHKLHDYGDCYLQIGRQIIISTDIQEKNKYHKRRHLFIPLNIPLLHINFTANNREKIKQKQKIDRKIESNTSTANMSISDFGVKLGNALNPVNVIENIGDGIKKLLPNTDNNNDNNINASIFQSPPSILRTSPDGTDRKRRSLFGVKMKNESHAFHHDIDDIGFMPSNKGKKLNKNKINKTVHKNINKNIVNNDEFDEYKLKLLASHRPSTDLTIRIWDVYKDFDKKMNPYVAYVLRIRDEIKLNGDGDDINSTTTQRIEWTIKTRYSKLHSFHRAIQRDKILKNKNIKIVAQFPAKSIITKMDAKYIAERKKQLIAYFNTLHRYPDVLLSDAVYQLVIPPVLVEKYGDYKQQKQEEQKQEQQKKISISEEKKSNEEEEKNKNKNNNNNENENEHSFLTSTHPVLPSQNNIKQQLILKDESPDISLPVLVGADMAAASFYATYYGEEDDDDDIDDIDDNNDGLQQQSFIRQRRGSYPGCDAPNKYRQPPPLHGDFRKTNQPKLSIFTSNNNNNGLISIDAVNKLEEDSGDLDDDDKEDKEDKKTKKTKKDINISKLERFRIEDYEHLIPSLIKLIEAFLELEKRSTFGSSLTMAATSMMSWFFNGYIANKLYNQSKGLLTMDGTLSYLMQWICDLIWIPPQYEMNEETTKQSTNDEINKLRIEARECIQKMFEVYIGDNVPKIIGQKKQLELCMIKFWRFLQQNQLLKHLTFSVIDALLQDLFPERVSRRYQRRAWIADKFRKKQQIEKKKLIEKKLEKNKRLKQHQHHHHYQHHRSHPNNINTKRSKSDPMEQDKDNNNNNDNVPRAKSQGNLLNKQQKLAMKQRKTNKLVSVPQNGIIQKSPSPQHTIHTLQRTQSRDNDISYNKNKHSQKQQRTVPIKSNKSINNNNNQLPQSLNPNQNQNQMSRSKSRPLLMPINDNGPNIDIFSGGGSLFSDYTKKIMGIGINKKQKNSINDDDGDDDDDDDDESTESDDDDDDESSSDDDDEEEEEEESESKSNDDNVWNINNNHIIYYSDDSEENKKRIKSKSVGRILLKNGKNKKEKNNRGFFNKLTRKNTKKRNKTNDIIIYQKNEKKENKKKKNGNDNEVKIEYWMH